MPGDLKMLLNPVVDHPFLHNIWFTYLLHAAESFLRSSLVLQLIKKFPTFYGTQKFITVLTSARIWFTTCNIFPMCNIYDIFCAGLPACLCHTSGKFLWHVIHAYFVTYIKFFRGTFAILDKVWFQLHAKYKYLKIKFTCQLLVWMHIMKFNLNPVCNFGNSTSSPLKIFTWCTHLFHSVHEIRKHWFVRCNSVPHIGTQILWTANL